MPAVAMNPHWRLQHGVTEDRLLLVVSLQVSGFVVIVTVVRISFLSFLRRLKPWTWKHLLWVWFAIASTL